jgi:hypothetical protein
MKAFNNFLAILAVLAIVALSAFNVHKVGEQAKMIAELQQYHMGTQLTTNSDSIIFDDVNIWDTVEDAIQYRKDDIIWLKTLEEWRNIPEISLRHILQYYGLNKGIEEIVEIYNENITYYKAYEDGYLAPKIPDSTQDEKIVELKSLHKQLTDSTSVN